MIQVIVMTSDRPPHPLRGFMHQWGKYFPGDHVGVVCGFTKPDYPLLPTFRFLSMGKQDEWPANRWSERLYRILTEVADDVFMLLLDDYWLTRPADTVGLRMLYDYMHQFSNVVKVDVTDERLYADAGNKYLWGYNTYNTVGYLDLIKSQFGSPYHLSLWGGLWRRDLLKRFLIPGETPQQIELSGTTRLSAVGDEVLVLGTRQCPLRHINAIQGRSWNYHETSGLKALSLADQKELTALGYDLGGEFAS